MKGYNDIDSFTPDTGNPDTDALDIAHYDKILETVEEAIKESKLFFLVYAKRFSK